MGTMIIGILTRDMNKKGAIFLWACILTGFTVRILSLPYNGIFDIATYHEWGLSTLKNGLDQSFMGIYFPLQYQIFELNSWLSTVLNIEYFVVYKTFNLVFDIGNLILLLLILRRLGVSLFYSLLYWFHPWFLNMFSLGYVDFQFTFFILCTLFFIFRETSRDYLIGGIFLGFAFMMKPQVLMIFLSLFIYAIARYLKNRDIRMFHLFLFPAIMFLNYFLFFWINTGRTSDLLNAYLHTADYSPSINAHFLNAWFPVAYFVKGENDPVYAVTDDMPILGFHARSIAILIVLALIIYFIIKIQKEQKTEKSFMGPYLATCFASFVVPFLMTGAHENHLFLGTVLIIPLLAKSKNFLFNMCVHIILLLQLVNLYGYYGIGEIPYIHLPAYPYSYDIALILSYVCTFVFFIILFFLFKRAKLFLHLADQ